MATRQEKETIRLAARKARLAASLKDNLKRRRAAPKKIDEPLQPSGSASGVENASLHKNKNEG